MTAPRAPEAFASPATSPTAVAARTWPRMAPASPFCLRPFADADAESFAQAVRESSASVGRWMAWAHAGYQADDARAWFAQCAQARADGTGHEFAIVERCSGALVGGCGLNQFNAANGFCNLGYWVRASRQRQGAALAATRALVAYGFEVLGLTRIEVVVACGNAPSLAVARRAGAQDEGVARNRLRVHGQPTDARMHAFVPPCAQQASGVAAGGQEVST